MMGKCGALWLHTWNRLHLCLLCSVVLFMYLVELFTVRDERDAVGESKCGKRIEDSDNMQILIVMCWRKCAIQPWEFQMCGLNAVIQRTLKCCISLMQYSVWAIVPIALAYWRWQSVWEAWKDIRIPIWFESTLLPQTKIFTVWMNLNFCVYTLLVYVRTCAVSTVNRMQRGTHGTEV